MKLDVVTGGGDNVSPVYENVLRKWIRETSVDPRHAFPGHGQMKPEQFEIDRLRKEVAKLKAERDILKKAAA